MCPNTFFSNTVLQVRHISDYTGIANKCQKADLTQSLSQITKQENLKITMDKVFRKSTDVEILQSKQNTSKLLLTKRKSESINL